ncbi:MAG: single-stranded-DNA-specific exonuclease RecJ [Alphaproteobacteria bacterium]|nr:single-stranded-DNA-specific exonuclease RecJ [Alphaproteobacteria bacterium]
MIGSEQETPAKSDDGYLGVTCSLTGKFWYQRGVLPDTNLGERGSAQRIDRMGLALAQSHNLPDIIGRLLALRGIDLDAAAGFLAPSLRRDLPDPSQFLDLDRATDRLADAIIQNEPIALLSDYDVDGGTSAALLVLYGRSLHRNISVSIPDRLTEGYGPNNSRIAQIAQSGAKILVMLDCGTTAHDQVAYANQLGLAVIICDHHISETALPPAFAVINPNRLDQPKGFGDLAAVGVSFMLLVGLNRALRQRGFFQGTVQEPDLLQFLDLVALGTVCDVMKLRGLNRSLVAQGLKILHQRRNLGLRHLIDRAGIKDRPSAYHLGYILGPRLNAGGRVGQCDLAVKLLTTDSETAAAALAENLTLLNQERQAIEADLLAEAMLQCESRALTPPLILIWGENWHVGVIGIIAARLKEQFNCPCLVAAVDATGNVKGSGRSVPGFDLGSAIVAARQAGLLSSGGGHVMAAGFAGRAENLPLLQQFLTERIHRQLGGMGDESGLEVPTGGASDGEKLRQNLRPKLAIDLPLHLGAATAELVENLTLLQPFGTGNSEPRFVFPHVTIQKAVIIGENHVKLSLSALTGSAKPLDAIAFRVVGTELGRVLLQDHRGAPLHIAGKLRPDPWQGQRQGGDKIQLILDDAAWG